MAWVWGRGYWFLDQWKTGEWSGNLCATVVILQFHFVMLVEQKAHASALMIFVSFAGSRFWLWTLCCCSVFTFFFEHISRLLHQSRATNTKAGFSERLMKVFFVFCSSSLALALVKECQVLLTYKQFIMSPAISHLLTVKTLKYQLRNITKTKDSTVQRKQGLMLRLLEERKTREIRRAVTHKTNNSKLLLPRHGHTSTLHLINLFKLLNKKSGLIRLIINMCLFNAWYFLSNVLNNINPFFFVISVSLRYYCFLNNNLNQMF